MVRQNRSARFSIQLKILPRLLILVCALCVLTSCWWSNPQAQLSSVRKLEESKKFNESALAAEKLVRSNADKSEALEAARIGGRITFLETKNYQQALFFYKHLVLYSTDENERSSAQKRIAEIYFERLGDQNNAVTELYKTLQLKLSLDDKIKYRLALAKALFYLNDFQQADSEIDEVLNLKPEGVVLFDTYLTRGNIYFSGKQLVKAIEVYTMLLDKFAAKAKEEHVGINLAICYEENSQFTKAIEVLGEIKQAYPNPQFIDEKIAKLQERAEQMPGAKGLRK